MRDFRELGELAVSHQPSGKAFGAWLSGGDYA